MEWSPTRREFLGVAGAGSLPVASGGTVSWGNVTDAVPDSPFAPEPEVQWTTDLGGGPAFVGEPVDGTIHVRRGEAVHALSLADGDERWRIDAEGGIPNVVVARRSASATDKTVYVTDSDGVHAFESGTGPPRERSKWRYAGERYPSVLLATPETVVVNDDGLVGLSPTDGSERWRFDPPGQIRPPFRVDGVAPTRAGGDLYVGTTEAGFYALSVADGSIRWEIDLSDDGEHRAATPEPVPLGRVDGNAFAWEPNDGALYALDAADGTVRWRFEATESGLVFFGAIRTRGIYLNDGPVLRAISLDGDEAWRFDAGAELHGVPVVGEEGIYVGSERGAVALEPTGAVRWHAPGNFAPFALRDGTLVGYRPDAEVRALGARDGELRWRFALPEALSSVPRFADGTAVLATESGTVYGISTPGSSLAYDAYRTATSTAGLAVGGLLGGALALGAYRRRNRDDAAADSPEATTFENYELLELVAETEAAEIHDARTPAGERVTLERLTVDALSDERFAEAVETWAALDRAGVLELREWGTDPTPWFVTERVDATLAERAADLSVEEIAHAIADAAEAVHRAHREGVVHGGLAPESVLFVGDEVRVGDWGLAAALADSLDEETAPADDTARLAETPRDLLAREQVAGLSEVLDRALADDPAERYDSALKFADALRWAVRE